METTNNVRKKGNKKLGKVTIKVCAAVIGMVLISFAISAQGSSPFPGNNTSTKMAGSMDDHENAILLASASPVFFAYSSGTAASMHDTAKEKRLEIESWMIDSNYFGKTVCYTDEKDELLMVENWMIDECNFNSYSVTIADDIDEELSLESWMTNEYFWGK